MSPALPSRPPGAGESRKSRGGPVFVSMKLPSGKIAGHEKRPAFGLGELKGVPPFGGSTPRRNSAEPVSSGSPGVSLFGRFVTSTLPAADAAWHTRQPGPLLGLL